MKWKLAIAAILGFILGAISMGCVNGLMHGMKRSWSKRTAADCRSISTALEAYRTAVGSYPPFDGSTEHLSQYLSPKYLRSVPSRDMSNEPYLVVMNGANAVVISVGGFGTAVEEGRIIRGIWATPSEIPSAPN